MESKNINFSFVDLVGFLREAGKKLTLRWILLAVGLVVVFGIVGFSLDDWAYEQVKEAGQEPWEIVAERFSYWGDFLPGTVPLTLGLWFLGFRFKKIRWQRAAFASLLAALLAGGLVSALRLTAGRTRPDATLENAVSRLGYVPHPFISLGHFLPDGKLLDGFYGIKRPAMFQGFPSGHSATSVATATTFVVALPEIGWVLIPAALGVCWSRLYLHKHHLSDVTVGASVGLIFGMFFGRVARSRS